jgi:hypothetical protein
MKLAVRDELQNINHQPVEKKNDEKIKSVELGSMTLQE